MGRENAKAGKIVCMKNKKMRGSIFLYLILIAVVVFAFFYILYNNKQIDDLQDKLSSAMDQLQEYEEENERISRLMDPENEDALKEEEARKHGYGYPDESRYQNITPGNEDRN